MEKAYLRRLMTAYDEVRAVSHGGVVAASDTTSPTNVAAWGLLVAASDTMSLTNVAAWGLPVGEGQRRRRAKRFAVGCIFTPPTGRLAIPEISRTPARRRRRDGGGGGDASASGAIPVEDEGDTEVVRLRTRPHHHALLVHRVVAPIAALILLGADLSREIIRRGVPSDGFVRPDLAIHELPIDDDNGLMDKYVYVLLFVRIMMLKHQPK
ncbi:hypothetical protein GUJ93_ZPchr0016g2500 [Zizania palustris]|uniref:Uncharacterized protein n=1 Tax=Zizania palustris TaxID=103762 RepID=A0A8J5VT24_ZIZPA|nr:hypothetical protein GUJ93_ZPchr0016g2500 [Zizania palustris]